jgi:hypothetical protein
VQSDVNSWAVGVRVEFSWRILTKKINYYCEKTHTLGDRIMLSENSSDILTE